MERRTPGGVDGLRACRASVGEGRPSNPATTPAARAKGCRKPGFRPNHRGRRALPHSPHRCVAWARERTSLPAASRAMTWHAVANVGRVVKERMPNGRIRFWLDFGRRGGEGASSAEFSVERLVRGEHHRALAQVAIVDHVEEWS